MIAAVVCVDKNFGIGNKGELLVNIPEDMKLFKKITSNGAVIMGRKTWDSLPKKPLPDRTNIIITKKCKKQPKIWDDSTIHSNMKYIKAWLAKKDVIDNNNGIYVIGGGQIYSELLNSCERVYITKVFTESKADTYFPNIDEKSEWELTESSEIKEHKGVQYQFCIYDRCDYEIVKIQTPENINSANGFDFVVTVKAFNGYKTVVLQVNKENKITVFADTWEYLHNEKNLVKFIDKVQAFERGKNNE